MNPRSECAAPSWKIHLATPNAAPVASRLVSTRQPPAAGPAARSAAKGTRARARTRQGGHSYLTPRPPGRQSHRRSTYRRTLNCAAVTTEAAAHAFKLSFIPIEHHAVQIWVAEQWLKHPAAHALCDLIATAAFTQRISQFCGYDLTGCGTRLVP